MIDKIYAICYKAGAETVMTYIKVQSSAINDVTIEDEMKKYD